MTHRLLTAAALLLALTACGVDTQDRPNPMPQAPPGGYCYETPDGGRACEHADGTDAS